MREQDFLKLLTHLKNKLEAEAALFAEPLITGRVSSYEDYKHTVGIIRGLTIAIEHIRGVAKYDDEDE